MTSTQSTQVCTMLHKTIKLHHLSSINDYSINKTDAFWTTASMSAKPTASSEALTSCEMGSQSVQALLLLKRLEETQAAVVNIRRPGDAACATGVPRLLCSAQRSKDNAVESHGVTQSVVVAALAPHQREDNSTVREGVRRVGSLSWSLFVNSPIDSRLNNYPVWAPEHVLGDCFSHQKRHALWSSMVFPHRCRWKRMTSPTLLPSAR